MNRDERRACDAIAAALIEEGGRMGLPIRIGDGPGTAIACKVDVSIGQPAVMDAVTVRVTRKPLATEIGSFPDSRSVTMKGDHVDPATRREVGAIMRDLARICRRGIMLTEAGINHHDAPLWSYEIDEISLRLLKHGCGGSLDIRKHQSTPGMPLIQYMPVPWQVPSEAPLLSGIGVMLHMPEGVVLVCDEDDARTISINERKRRIGVRGATIPETVRQWISTERPPLRDVIGHAAFTDCQVRIVDARDDLGWITFGYDPCIVPAAPPPNAEAVAWREI